MRLTVTIDGDLFAKAVQTAGPGVNEAELLREVINTLVRVQAARRLAALGGTRSGMAGELTRMRALSRSLPAASLTT